MKAEGLCDRRIILASSSPRRLDLLKQIHIIPDIIEAPEVDETILRAELPAQYSLRVAKLKFDKVTNSYNDDIVIAADTVVAVGRRILGKASDDNDVVKFLRLISGRNHDVYSSVVMGCKDKVISRTVISKVKFKLLSDLEIESYVKSKEGLGKAGGYAIQGLADSFVKRINGSYSNIVGLPLFETSNMLRGFGVLK